ncbi:aminoglycoside phosphotransferase family protein [Nocardioides abyssi]|uniref:Aminoglycoside phosphotransferase family protein n=1 Tax=Nocardioides abyssi TaxID=3058370 RepID=A0ABT8EXE2_9ACTN|nr:aminoglycoside phosphotransferase family protein [Nocardioides abyssi]MDN4162853.1 aminoglycoside phosphotransferase family protein [Nocardioides abyssi]
MVTPVAELLEEWGLTPDGPPLPARRASVLPVVGERGPAVLKVGVVHPVGEVEGRAAHEALALQRWGGHGAVRLLRADPHRRALLLERLAGPDAADPAAGLWDAAAGELVGAHLADLHVDPLPQVPRLAAYVAEQGRALAALPRDAPLPRRLVEQALALGRDLVADPGDERLLHGDLHPAHLVAAGPEAPDQWRAVSPKPLAGDPHSEVAPLLWHQWDDVVGDVRGSLRRRFLAVVDAALLDEDRARDWVVLRTVHRALAALDDRDRVTRCIAVVKAVQE